MTENKSQILLQFNSPEELVDFFDAHDMGEYESDLLETDFDIKIERKHYFISVDEQLMNGLLEVAREQQVSVEIIVNSWLKEKISLKS